MDSGRGVKCGSLFNISAHEITFEFYLHICVCVGFVFDQNQKRYYVTTSDQMYDKHFIFILFFFCFLFYLFRNKNHKAKSLQCLNMLATIPTTQSIFFVGLVHDSTEMICGLPLSFIVYHDQK